MLAKLFDSSFAEWKRDSWGLAEGDPWVKFTTWACREDCLNLLLLSPSEIVRQSFNIKRKLKMRFCFAKTEPMFSTLRIFFSLSFLVNISGKTFFRWTFSVKCASCDKLERRKSKIPCSRLSGLSFPAFVQNMQIPQMRVSHPKPFGVEGLTIAQLNQPTEHPSAFKPVIESTITVCHVRSRSGWLWSIKVCLAGPTLISSLLTPTWLPVHSYSGFRRIFVSRERQKKKEKKKKRGMLYMT